MAGAPFAKEAKRPRLEEIARKRGSGFALPFRNLAHLLQGRRFAILSALLNRPGKLGRLRKGGGRSNFRGNAFRTAGDAPNPALLAQHRGADVPFVVL
jgi:hypothetical protein